MCLNPRIIINPAFVQASAFGRYRLYSIRGEIHPYSRYDTMSFDYARFSVRRNGITEDILDECYAIDPQTGDTLPLYIQVACGKCDACLHSRRVALKSRMLLEQASHENPPLFVTLTYSDKFLPEDGVNVRDVQLFLKRFRSYMEYKFPNFSKFRYACFSEYGSKYGRPHYHLIIFGSHIGNESPRNLLFLEKELRKCWQMGFVYVKLCDSGCFNYVSKYVLKKSNVPECKKPNFQLMSRRTGGLGVPFIRNNSSVYLQLLNSPEPLLKLVVMGKEFKIYIPKCLRDSLFPKASSIIPARAQKAFKRINLLTYLLSALQTVDSSCFNLCYNYNKDHGFILPSPNGCISSLLYEKYGCLYRFNRFVYVDKQFKRVAGAFASECENYIKEYVQLYNYLKNLDVPIDFIFEMSYLREIKLKQWNMALLDFIESQVDDGYFQSKEVSVYLSESLFSQDNQ